MSINGITEKIGVGLTMSRRWTDPPIQIMVALAGGIPALIAGEYMIATKLGVAYTVLPFIAMYLFYQFIFLSTPPADTEAYLIFKVRGAAPATAMRASSARHRAGATWRCGGRAAAAAPAAHGWLTPKNSRPLTARLAPARVWQDNKLKARWGKRKIPMHILVEEFLADNIAFKKDCYETLINDREAFIDWRPNWDLIKFLLDQLFPWASSSFKSIAATAHEIADHYDRGNDFFNAFLGPKMIYTSAFYKNLDENLEQAQVNKLNMLCEKVHLKPGMTFLDIGCGWGTLVRHAAKEFGATATGVTLSAEGAA